MLASYKGYTEIIRMLLSAGAFVNYRLGIVPNSPTLSYATALHFACEYNNNEIIKLLISYGAMINMKTEHNSTPLYIAIMKNNVEVVERMLVEYEDIPAYYLEYAIEFGNKKIVELLENTIHRTTKLHILANTAINMDIILS
jgi:ankyrin repeat protein